MPTNGDMPTSAKIVRLLGRAEGLGVVASYARPGGNITGVTHFKKIRSRRRLPLEAIAVPASSLTATGREWLVTDAWPPHDNRRGRSKTALAAVGYLQSPGGAGWNRRSALLFVRRPVYRLAWPRSLFAPPSLSPRLASCWRGQRTITLV